MIDNIQKADIKNPVPVGSELDDLRKLVSDFLKDIELTPPLHEDYLFGLVNDFLKTHPEQRHYSKLITILINNASWENTVANVPFNKRVLLLPKCFRHTSKCKAKIDELGLLCEFCGSCKLSEYINQAEQLGYNVIVSEGSGAVSVLLNTGQIECVVGVACLESFERTFPISLKHAIPSIAIPLYNSNCKDSETHEEWLLKTLKLQSNKSSYEHISLDKFKQKTNKWFTSEYLNALFPQTDESTQIAIKWLQAGGKRWRPLILNALYAALVNKKTSDENIAKLSVAIECFHKASLAHDDIVDDDTERYGADSLLKNHSLGITLNTGDLLLSYGYQLIAESGYAGNQIKDLLLTAAQGHKELSLGQGEELLWQQKHKMPSVEKVLEIFALKTAPAFEVSLKFAAIAANGNIDILRAIKHYSKALGIAYQIKDDLDDFNPTQLNSDIHSFRPSLIMAILNEKYPKKFEELINDAGSISSSNSTKIFNLANDTGACNEAEELLKTYKNKALESLNGIQNTNVKILLYRLVNTIIG